MGKVVRRWQHTPAINNFPAKLFTFSANKSVGDHLNLQLNLGYTTFHASRRTRTTGSRTNSYNKVR